MLHRRACGFRSAQKSYLFLSDRTGHTARVGAAAQGSAVRGLRGQSLEPISATSTYKRDSELQAALDDLFEDTINKGRRRVHHEEIAHHVERIKQLGERLGLDRVNPEWSDGAFRGLLTSIHVGISENDACTMARLTFGKVGPSDLKVQLDQAKAAGLAQAPDQFKGPLAKVAEDPARGYAIVTHFKILSNGVLGRMTLKALYDIDVQDPAKLHVTFCGFLLEPAFPDAESLALWREALAEANPGMAPDGGIYVPMEPRPRGFERFILVDPELQLAITSRGSLITMQRVPVSQP